MMSPSLAGRPRPGFALTLRSPLDPDRVFSLLLDPSRWWFGDPGVSGPTSTVGAEFSYRYGTVHRSRQRVTVLDRPHRLVWQVTDSALSFVPGQDEWAGTEVEFLLRPEGTGTEVRFAHRGLVPPLACYESCSAGWTSVIGDDLAALVEGSLVGEGGR